MAENKKHPLFIPILVAAFISPIATLAFGLLTVLLTADQPYRTLGKDAVIYSLLLVLGYGLTLLLISGLA